MSRRITGLVVVFAIFVTLAVVVYSRQATNGHDEDVARLTVQKQQNSPQVNADAGQANKPKVPNKAICTLPVTQSPNVGGFRLRIRLDEMLALFPGSQEDPEVRTALSTPPSQFGVTSFVIHPDRYESAAKFAGIKEITISLLDGRVSTFTLGYYPLELKHVDEFVTKVAQDFNLPATDAWEPYVGLDDQLKLLKCDGFEISAFSNAQVNYVLTKDKIAEQVLKDRKAKAREKAALESKQ
jgi:hypothetical protein